MKKRITFAAVLLSLCLLLAACGAQANEADAPDDGFISATKAIEIAEDHFGIENGASDPKTGFVMSYAVIQEPTEDAPIYKVALQWMVEVNGEPDHQSRLDVVTIDAISGEVAN